MENNKALSFDVDTQPQEEESVNANWQSEFSDAESMYQELLAMREECQFMVYVANAKKLTRMQEIKVNQLVARYGDDENRTIAEFRLLVERGFTQATPTNCEKYHKVVKEERQLALSSPDDAVNYAASILGGRFLEGEAVILSDPYWAGLYAADVLGRRWPEAEKVILASGQLPEIWDYLSTLVKGKWEEAEPVISKAPDVNSKYHEYLEYLQSDKICFVEPSF